MPEKKKEEPAAPKKASAESKTPVPAAKLVEKTAQPPTKDTLQSTQQASTPAKSEIAPPPNDGYVTREQERSWFKRIMLLSWTELKRYRKNIAISIAIHGAPIIAVLCVWAVIAVLKIGDIKYHKAKHIAAYEMFPLTELKTMQVRVYFENKPDLKQVKERFKALGKNNGYTHLVTDNLMSETTHNMFLNLFSNRSMSFLFHVSAASDKSFEYQLLTADWVMHGDLLPAQGPFAYPNSHDAIPLRDGYIAEVAMLLNEAYKQVYDKKNVDTLPKRKHTAIAPAFNYPVHRIMNVLLYIHATLQILHVIRMVGYIVEEKETGLKTLLRTMGISSVEFYVTHALVSFLILTLNSLVLYVPICFIIKFYYFGSVLLGLLAYNLCMVMFGLMMSTLFSKRHCIGRVIFAIGVILHLESYLATPNSTIGRGMLTSLNFASAFYYYMDSISSAALLGLPSLPLLSDIDVRMFGILALIMMIVDSVSLMLMLVYLSYVYPGGQETGAPWYFLFTRVFWAGQPRPRNVLDDTNWTRQAETAGKRCIIYDGVDVENRLEAAFFEAYTDQVLGIYGHKNSGRSTLLRLAAMIQKPDAGSVFVMEEDMVNMDHLNIVGFMDSTTAPLFDHLTCKEHMELFGQLRMSDDHDQLAAVLTCLELEEAAVVSSLNASMKRRLQLGLAYTGGTKIIVLDQPTEGCDLYTRSMIRDFIAANKIDRTTIGIFSSATETDALCDRIALIARGYVLSCGSLDWMIETFGGFTSVLTLYPKDDYFTEDQRSKLKTFFTDKLPDANIVVDVGHNFTVLVKNEMTEQIGEILATLDKNPEKWGMMYAEVQRLTVERMYSMLDHSEATEDSLKTDRAYVNDIDRILTSPRYSLISLIWAQIIVVAKRKMLFTIRFMLNLFAQMTSFAVLFFLALFLLALFSQHTLAADKDINAANMPRMRVVGTQDAVKFAESHNLKGEVLAESMLLMNNTKTADWFYKYPAPLIGIFDSNGVVNTMCMTSFRMGKLFATTLADNYRLNKIGKGKEVIKFKIVTLLLEEKYATIHHFYGIVPSRSSNLVANITAIEEIQIISSLWYIWLISCFVLAFSLSLASLFPAYEASSGVLRKMRIPSDGTPTVIYWCTVAFIDLVIHLLLLTIFVFGFIYQAGPPTPMGFLLIYGGWIGAYFSVVPVVYMIAAYLANPTKVFSMIILTFLWVPFCVVASHYFGNISVVVKQFALNDDSAVRTLLFVSPVHASALLTTFISGLTGQDRYVKKIPNAEKLFETVRKLFIHCWSHVPAWLILLIIGSKLIRQWLQMLYLKIVVTEFNEPPDFNLPKQMAIANNGEDNEESGEGNNNTRMGRVNKTLKTGEDKGYDQLPGIKNRDIIVAKKDLERAANNTVYDNLKDDNVVATPQKSIMKSIKRAAAQKSMMRSIKREQPKTSDNKKTEEVSVEPAAGAAAAPLVATTPKTDTKNSFSKRKQILSGKTAKDSKDGKDASKEPIKDEKEKEKAKDIKSPSKEAPKDAAKDAKPETPLPARIAVVAESKKVVKAPKAPDAPKTDSKKSKDGKPESAKPATAPTAPAATKPAAAAPATPATPAATPAAAAAKKDDKKELPKVDLKSPTPSNKTDTKPNPSDKKKPEPAKPPQPPSSNAKTDPQDKKPAANMVTTQKQIEATIKQVVDDKAAKPLAASTPPDGKTPKDGGTKDTQGATPAPTPKGGSKKRQGAGREESDDSDPEDVVVVPSPFCCGISTATSSRGGAGADTKTAEDAKKLLPQKIEDKKEKEKKEKKDANKTITPQKGPTPHVGDGMTMMARSRLTLSMHKPNEASKQRRMVKLDAPVPPAEPPADDVDGLCMFDVYVNQKRTPQQFRLEGASINNIKIGSSVVVFGDSTTSNALLDVLTGDAIATKGAIAIAGKFHTNARISSIRDHTSLPDFLTVREHLELTAASYGIRYMTIVERLLELVGITDKEQWTIKDLQMPDRLLVALCTALMNRPHLIVLDEPISALCPTSSLTMWYTLSIIRNLWGTVVMTQTSSPMEVEMMASHILLTQPRVISEVMQPYDIKQRYLTQLFVRVSLRQGADKNTICAIMNSQLQARPFRDEARGEEVLSFVVELASRKLHVAFKQVCGFLLNLPVSFTVSTLPLDCALEGGGRDLPPLR